ncbi:hypothetical protein V5799_020274 [Amblyomma americanum]|uniref:Uncharacterized protein n=1 Tax=Amblyomma americanum TaxID=6943 RepID=A0AAQ4EV79_AMBAM
MPGKCQNEQREAGHDVKTLLEPWTSSVYVSAISTYRPSFIGVQCFRGTYCLGLFRPGSGTLTFSCRVVAFLCVLVILRSISKNANAPTRPI